MNLESSYFISELIMFFFKPLGFSYATLIPYCNSGIGNLLHGLAVKNNLNSAFTFILAGSLIVSHSRSNSPNQSSNKWQLFSNTHVPSLLEEIIFLLAFSSLPLPRLSVMRVSSFPFVLANSLTVSPGSEPLPSMNMVGDLSSVSL